MSYNTWLDSLLSHFLTEQEKLERIQRKFLSEPVNPNVWPGLKVWYGKRILKVANAATATDVTITYTSE